MATTLTIAAMYLIPLGLLVWLFKANPGYALIAVVVIGVALGISGVIA